MLPQVAAAQIKIFLLCCCAFFFTLVVSQQQSQTNLQFYMHDNVFVPNASAIMVAGANSSQTFTFGTVFVIDDAITEGPSPTSKSLGRGQGTYMVSSLDASSLLITFTAVFSDRNGTLSFHGADKIIAPSREIAVVGGTGIYRFAQGYGVITTSSSVGFSVILAFNVTFQHSDEIKSSSSPSTGSAPGSSSPSLGDSSSAVALLSWENQSRIFTVLLMLALVYVL